MRATAKALLELTTVAIVMGTFAVPPARAVEDAAEQTLPPVEVVTPKEGDEAKPAKAANIDDTAPAAGKGSGKSGSAQRIAVLVNDEPVTAREIEQRRGMASTGSGEIAAYVRKNARARWEKLVKDPKINDEFRAYAMKRGVKTKDEALALQKSFLQDKQKALIEQLKRESQSSAKKGDKDQAIEDLIDERLKLQEAKRLNVVASDEEVDKILTGMAERNKLTMAQFAAQLKERGTDISAMRNRFRTELSWRDVIRRQFGWQVAISESDVDRLVAKAPSGSDDVSLDVQRLTLPISAKADQTTIAGRMREAETLRGKFTNCKEVAALAQGAAGAKLENLGARKPSTIPEPTRSLLLEAKNEDILPPTIDGDGVELWIVCGRQTVKADQEKREAAQSQLRQREFELLAKRHLRDLREDAHIEYR